VTSPGCAPISRKRSTPPRSSWQKLAEEQAQKAKAPCRTRSDALNRGGAQERRGPGGRPGEGAERRHRESAGRSRSCSTGSRRWRSVSQDQQKSLDAANQVVAQRQKELDKAEHPTDRMGILHARPPEAGGGPDRSRPGAVAGFPLALPQRRARAQRAVLAGASPGTRRRSGTTRYRGISKSLEGVQGLRQGPRRAPQDRALSVPPGAGRLPRTRPLFFDEVIQGHKGSTAAKAAHEKAAECRKARKGPEIRREA